MAGRQYVTVTKKYPNNTLSSIAEYYLGDAKLYRQLAAINNISNPDLIYVGQKIYLQPDTNNPVSNTSDAMTRPVITSFGVQNGTDNTLFVTWKWNRSYTKNYTVRWTYGTNDGIAYEGLKEDTTKQYSVFTPPANAKRIQFKVKANSLTRKAKAGIEIPRWTSVWSEELKYELSNNPPVTPSVPSVTITGHTLTAKIESVASNVKTVEFQIIRDNASVYKTGKAAVKTTFVSYSCTIAVGSEYKVRCRAISASGTSGWTEYTGNVGTQPAVPTEITSCKAASDTSVYLEWSAVKNAETYEIQYATVKDHLDNTNQASSASTSDSTNHYTIGGLESGVEYFFRVRAKNSNGESAWTAIKSVAIGNVPVAPTTWSSTTSAIVGEGVVLYWVHNAEDGSSQTFAELKVIIGDNTTIRTINSSADSDSGDKIYSYIIDTAPFKEGTTIRWCARTAGVTQEYGDWSVMRTIDVYAPATLELNVTDVEGTPVDVLTTFPFYVKGVPGPNTQAPIGYHLSVISNETYETTDQIGNIITVNKGEQVYSQYFDTSDILLVELSAGNIDLENNISYTVECVVSMNSGLRAEASAEFTVNWTDVLFSPNAEITVDTDVYAAHIRPYCEDAVYSRYKVNYSDGAYIVTSEPVGLVFGETIDAATTTGEQVYEGVTAFGEDIYYCEVETTTVVDNVLLSVYRREFDGSFVEIASDIENGTETFVTDPHPSLDYARYRIVAKHTSTGAVSYYDPPGQLVGGNSIVIQWDEDWSNFDINEGDVAEQPAWSGSMLKLKANVDVSDSYSSDSSLVSYIGRKRPVSYYGTQLGETSSWSTVVPKDDKETLYALRRLAVWMGDVYVREPSGSGYWANIKVAFSQSHDSLVIPVSFDVTRVEGGI